ncbi:hypothetical protein GCM10008934_16080 [Virgibacillus salarius]|uniref:YveK family protein n=1 Tax=Virgibacillus salarius TaxID=447199 RepID=UPI0031D3CE9B
MDNETINIQKKKKDINLKEVFDLLKKRAWLVIAITILFTSAGYLYNSFNNTPIYQTSTRVIIGADSEYMKTLMVMITDPLIMDKVKEELQLSQTSEELAEQIEVARIEDSQVVQISVRDSDSAQAVEIANTTATAFKSEIADILDFKEVQLLSSADENHQAINGGQHKIVIISFIFGAITGLGLIFLLDSLDGTIRKESELELVLGVPVIGSISNVNKKKFVKRRRQRKINVRGETADIK